MTKSRKFLHAIFNPFKFHTSREGQEENLEKIASQKQKVFTFQSLISTTKDFHPNNKLDQGGFGPVFKGKLEDGREIAVNVVKLLGYCAHGPEKLLVYEYIANESLDKLLFRLLPATSCSRVDCKRST